MNNAHVEPTIEEVVRTERLVLRVAFTPSAMAGMLRSSRLRPDVESGGLMLGRCTHDGTLVISAVSGPGVNALRSHGVFNYDPEAQRGFLSAMQEITPATLAGYWHCHPPGTRTYSSQDLRTFYDVITDDGWNLAGAAFPIVLRDRHGNADGLVVYYMQRYDSVPVEVPWICVPEDSELARFAGPYDDSGLDWGCAGDPVPGLTPAKSNVAEEEATPRIDLDGLRSELLLRGVDLCARDGGFRRVGCELRTDGVVRLTAYIDPYAGDLILHAGLPGKSTLLELRALPNETLPDTLARLAHSSSARRKAAATGRSTSCRGTRF